jgi:hypothetical protein
MMKFKSLVFVVSFAPTVVMAQSKLVTPPVVEKSIAVSPSAKLPAAPNSPNLATKPPAPQNPAMLEFQATHGGNMGSAPQNQPQQQVGGPSKPTSQNTISTVGQNPYNEVNFGTVPPPHSSNLEVPASKPQVGTAICINCLD